MEFVDTLEQHFGKHDGASRVLDSIEEVAKKSKFTHFFSRAIFVNNSSSTTATDSTSIVKEDYSRYDGKVIRTLELVGIGPFETNEVYTDDVQSNFITNSADAIHMNTRAWVLRNNMMFRQGDRFNGDLLIHNLAFFRSLPFIYDARVVIGDVAPDADSIDMQIVIRDVWSIGVDVQRLTFTRSSVGIFDRNILGLGLELRLNLVYERDLNRQYGWGYGLIQENKNMRGTFISSRLEYTNMLERRVRFVSLNREILPLIKLAGGVSYNDLEIDNYFVSLDTIMKVRTVTQDIWGGRAFDVSSKPTSSGQRFAVLARYARRLLRTELPSSSQPIYYPFEKSTLYISSFSLYRQRLYTDRLVFGNGVHENIPYGYNATIQVGFEDHKYASRFYGSVSYKYAWQHRWGYIHTDVGIYSFIRRGRAEQGFFETRINYFSPLFPVGRIAARQFIVASYVQSINRGIGEGNYLNLFSNTNLNLESAETRIYGRNRLSLSSETDIYTTARILGFRLVVFNFLDTSWIGNNSMIFSNDFFLGVGMGVRIRNDRLVFRSVQLKFGWYPNITQSGLGDFFYISSMGRYSVSDFIPLKPDIKEFK